MNDSFSVNSYSIDNILNEIDRGNIAVPDIQRPFVWSGSKVRDLIDSLYHGYPTGYLIVWQNPSIKLKDGSNSQGKQILIDGQQRVTALMTAIVGKKVLTKNYKETTIRIAFNPQSKRSEETFAVQNSAHLNSNFWIPDISEIFKPNFSLLKFIKTYINKNPEADEEKISDAIQKLLSIKHNRLGVIQLASELDINEVTEIFVRINSQGQILNEADFAMSKIAADEIHEGNILRKAIDYFCHLAVNPFFYSQIESVDENFISSDYAQKISWLKDSTTDIYVPDYSDMLRVSFMHIFNRGRMSVLVSLLSGRDFEERIFKEEIADDSFEKLKEGILNFINKYNFQDFVLAIKSAGFISSNLINSKITMDFVYTLYLILKRGNEVPKTEVKKYIQKWFVLSTLTSRYVNSPESQMDKDLRSIDSKGFLTFFNEEELSLLSDTFWSARLPQNLETSSINSPYFKVYIAAQIFFNDNSLLSSSAKVKNLFETIGDVHHIFPKQYLIENGYSEKTIYNQVANYAYLDKSVNISIGKRSPNDYFSSALEYCKNGGVAVGTITSEEVFWKNLEVNCIPAEIIEMTVADYDKFLKIRRKFMAQKIRDYYHSL
ncbi:MAG: DUF262 domain-containing protein [Selenomonadaceae bacterium]|nr:DUF262 domain-containing protein [Selenomonadaceae bacterium]